jgi:hypothetical protein
MTMRDARRWTLLGVITLAIGSVAGSAVAAPAGVAAQATPKTLTVPFAPPTDVDLRYRVRLDRPLGGRPNTWIRDQTLRFAHAGTGYILTLTTTAVSDGGKMVRASDGAVGASVRIMMAPTSFDVDATGHVLRVRDWARIKTLMIMSTTAETVRVEPDPGTRSDGRATYRLASSKYDPMTAKLAVSDWLQHWDGFFGLAGTEMAEGASLEGDTVIETGLAPVPSPVHASTTLGGERSGTLLHLVVVTTLYPAKAGPAIASFIQEKLRNTPLKDKAARAWIVDMGNRLRGFDLRDETDARLDATTGLLRSAIMTRSVTDRDGTTTSRTQIDRLD